LNGAAICRRRRAGAEDRHRSDGQKPAHTPQIRE
jgi:hypothetical protein